MKKLLIILTLLGALALSGCGNKTIIDTKYTFTKATLFIGDQILELDVKTWKDYDSDSQIQIVTPDGTVYLTHSSNIILRNK